MPVPLSFLTLELTSKVKNPTNVPDIIKSSILTRTKKSHSASAIDGTAQYLYSVDEQYWKPKQTVSEEATSYHGISNNDLKNKPEISGLKIRNYIVCWANIYTFKVLQENKVKFYNHRFIFLNSLLNAVGDDGSKSMSTWSKIISKNLSLNIDDSILENPSNKTICLTFIFEYLRQKMLEIYSLDIDKHYDLVAAIQYTSALKSKKSKNLKVHTLMQDAFNRIKKLIDDGYDIKSIKMEYFKVNRYKP